MAKVESLKDAGNKHFKNGDHWKAIKCYKEGLDIEQANPTLNCNLAQAYLAVNKFEEAEVHAVVTLALQEDSVKGFYRATKAALGLGKRERALQYLQKGLVKCSKAEELRSLFEEVTKEGVDAELSECSNVMEDAQVKVCDQEGNENRETKEESAKKTQANVLEDVDGQRHSRNEQNKLRSRSTGSRNTNSSKSSVNLTSSRSISVNRTSTEKTKLKIFVEPRKDKFLETLVKVQNELSPEEKPPHLREREILKEKQKKLLLSMSEGSKALEIGLARQASEKYRSALDIMSECNIEVFGLSEVDRIVLKYSLSISWIETLNYNSIVQSLGYLSEIETDHAAKLPAVYFGLGHAFYRLNRYKVALKHLDKGVQVIEKNLRITPHPWPGTMKTIVETTKAGLKESISKLVYECKTYREPDAICRYKNCLTVSSHVSPSEIIFYSDPDFIGYVVIICQENCRITYHVGCWKHFKENLSSAVKLTDKDILGQSCLTSDCVNGENEHSVIVRIEVYGDDGKIKTSCSKEPSKTDSVNEHRKEKKKKIEKTEKPLKIKTTRPRVRRLSANTQNVIKKAKIKTVVSSEEFAACLLKLAELRNVKFGLDESAFWEPRENHFGRIDISELKTYLTSHNSNDSETLRERKDFLFTYFYEYLNEEGPQKMALIEQKWHEEVSLFPGINDFISKHDGICDFLLQSYRFACIDDYLCLAHQMADTYQSVQVEVGESTTFILNNSVYSIEDDKSEDDSLRGNKLADNLVSHNSFSKSHFHGHGDLSMLSESETPSPDILWNRRDSESSPADIQETFIYFMSSEDEEEVETDDDTTENTCSENDSYENRNNDNFSNTGSNNNVLGEQVEIESTSFKFDDKTASTSSTHVEDSHTSFAEIVGKKIKPEHFDVAVQCENLCSTSGLVLKDVVTQTDHCDNLKSEMLVLEAENKQLKLVIKEITEHKVDMLHDLQKRLDICQKDLQDYEAKITLSDAEKEKLKNDFQVEIRKRENKLEVMKKKHQDQIDKLTKKKEEDSTLLKKNLESMAELNKDVEKKEITINRLEGQLRRSNEHILNIRKSFGEFKLDCYIDKCKERLQSMHAVMKYHKDTSSPSVSEMKNAIEAWETVARELQDTRDLLQVQYDILSQQLKNKISADCFLQLELAELPSEPPYPIQDIDKIIHVALEHKQQNPEQNDNGQNGIKMPTMRYSEQHHINNTPSYPSLLDIPHKTFHGDYYNPMPAHPFVYKRPFLVNNNAFPRTSSPYTGSQWMPLGPNENISNAVTRPWHNESGGSSLIKEQSKQNIPGEKPYLNLLHNENKTLHSVTVGAKLHSKSSEVLSNGESEQKILQDIKGGSQLSGDVKNIGSSSEKKRISTISGLIPIETSASGSEKDLLTVGSKPINLEIKHNPRPQQRWSYQRLLEELQKNFIARSEAELSESLAVVREKNGNKLSGMPITTIIRRVERVLEERSSKKVGNMGMDKFGGHAWGEVKETNVNWQNDDIENECVICHVNMENNKINLQCKHTFHKECIRQWLHTNSTCPICRKYTRLVDEFPPLA